MSNGRLPIPVQRPNGTTNSGTLPSTSTVCFFFLLIFFLVINNHRKNGVPVFCSDNLMNMHVLLPTVNAPISEPNSGGRKSNVC
jgi:hypothetical protein